jgi:transcription initiation factor TFIID TATA-box-binding protein
MSSDNHNWVTVECGQKQPPSLLLSNCTIFITDDGLAYKRLFEYRQAGGDPMAVIKIENVVASASLGAELDLQAIALALDGAEYEPEQFPGLIYRLKEPKTATLLFRSGKVVCTGAKSLEQVKTAVSKVVKQIEAAGVVIKDEPEIVVQNIVATSNLGAKINLNATAITLGLERVEYEPEQFPGLVYRLESPKVVMLLFGSGKLVCTGARKPEDAETAVDKITEELKSAGLLS